MKRRLNIAVAGAALLIAACAAFQAPKTPAEAVDQANIVLTATAQQVADNVRAGVMTGAEGASVLAQVKQYAGVVDEARGLLGAGDVTGAENRLRLVNTAILALHKRVAAKARAGGAQ